MDKTVIFTDSVAQIPPRLADHYHISVIPLYISIGGESFRDGIDILPGQLYQRMRTESIIPKTSQPSVWDFSHIFKETLDKGAQTIIYLSLSSKLSGAFETAEEAVETLKGNYAGNRIEIIDTATATIAQGYIAMQVAQAALDGKKLEDLLRIAQETRKKVGFIAMLETLYYLERGGRIGKAAYLAGSLMKVKPILTIDNEGLVEPLGQIRGDKKVLERLVHSLVEAIGERTPEMIAVMHADEIEKANTLKQLVQEHYDLKDIIITDFTPVMGAHAGPGVLGLGYQLK